ncbi:MAG: TerC family protein [Gammaproteobacteria bacterium]
MEFSADWLTRLAAIVLVDLVLAGDNAVVIALAARKLPPHLQKKAVIAGTAGAIVVRVVLVFFALQLLRLPGLSLVGGLLLYYIAWRLLDDGDHDREFKGGDSFWAAMKTIIIADTVMGLDNILAIAGASGGDLPLVIFGFLLSIPIMVGGSMLILKLLQKARWLLVGGCGLLAAIAGRMIADDVWLRSQREAFELSAAVEWAAILAAAVIFTAAARRAYAKKNGG